MEADEYEEESDEECRARLLAIFVLSCFGCIVGGMALGFGLDWLQRTVFK